MFGLDLADPTTPKMSLTEMDSTISRAVRYLHSTSAESTRMIRIMLEEGVRQRYGTTKDSLWNLNFSIIETEGVGSVTPEESTTEESKPTSSSEELELEDLTCIICKGMSVGARNILLECFICHDLYHQECHTPPISEVELESSENWVCINCKDDYVNNSIKKSPINQGKGIISSKIINQKYSAPKGL